MSHKIRKAIAITGIILGISSLIILLLIDDFRGPYIITNDKGETTEIHHSLILEQNHEYKIQVRLYSVDENYVVIEGNVTLFVDNEIVANATMYEFDDFNDPEGGFPSVEDTLTHYISPSAAVNLTISGVMILGDVWFIKIYKDLPMFLEEQFTLFIVILFCVGWITVVCIGMTWPGSKYSNRTSD